MAQAIAIAAAAESNNVKHTRERSGSVSSQRSVERRNSFNRERKNSISSNASNGERVRCQYWPECNRGDQCKFWHPKELCKKYPNCQLVTSVYTFTQLLHLTHQAVHNLLHTPLLHLSTTVPRVMLPLLFLLPLIEVLLNVSLVLTVIVQIVSTLTQVQLPLPLKLPRRLPLLPLKL